MAEADNHKAKDRARSSLSDVENGGFPIFIETVTGKTLTLRVSKSDSIGSIKKRIAESEGIPPSKQRLMVEDEFHPLADGRKLADYNIAKDDTMLLLPEQCGC